MKNRKNGKCKYIAADTTELAVRIGNKNATIGK